MKLATKIVLVFLFGALCIVGVSAWQMTQRHALWHETQEKQAENLAEALKPGLTKAYHSGGTMEVQRTIELTTRYLSGPQLRWMELDEQPAVRASISRRETVHFSVRAEHGDEQRSYIPMDLEGHDGAVEVKQPDLATESLHDFWRVSLVSMAAVAAMASAIILIGGVRLVGRPLHRLMTQVEEIGSGNFDQQVLLRSKDELGQLSLAISDMADRLRTQRSEIQRETEQRLEVEQQLRHADRLTTIGTLAAGVAHELGTPLNVVAGRASLIAGQQLSQAEVVESARAIKSESERMAAIIRQLMDFARRSPSKPARIDFCELVESTCKLMHPLSSQRGVDIDFQCQTDHRVLIGDSSQLKQVLTNLLSNAIQASPRDSRVHLVLKDRAKTVPPGREPCCDYVTLSIIDQGEGIPPDDLNRVFEPFFTTKDVGQGTGLGLSIAYGIIQEHGGWIDVRNLPNAGAEFSVCLPLPGMHEETWNST